METVFLFEIWPATSSKPDSNQASLIPSPSLIHQQLNCLHIHLIHLMTVFILDMVSVNLNFLTITSLTQYSLHALVQLPAISPTFSFHTSLNKSKTLP